MTLTSPNPVDIAAIERELTQLWKEAAEPGTTNHAVTRALTLNLVAVAPDSFSANRMTEVVMGLTRTHPNRTILVTANPAGPESRMEAWVQANCQLVAPGAPQVCGEQVSIEASGASVAQVPSLVLSLLVPELPVVLWWPGHSPFESPLFQRAQSLVDRVIVDSADFAHPERDLRRMAELNQSSTYVMSDLNWARLTLWRELVAQFFDSRGLLPHLFRLDKVVIDYERDPRQPANRAQALLLAGWLASRLGWTPLDNSVSLEGDLVRIHMRRPAPTVGPQAMRLVTIELHPAPVVEDSMDSLAAVRLSATDGVQASFVVERTDDPACARTKADLAGMTPIARIVRATQREETDLLATELRLLSRDRTFDETLRMAGVFARGM
ncbi:MAG: glucose-6-phosphate dehydrogenase assembly protein OpcA [Chloroflexaceae bacterium]|nr:glucose-6-phosphate dehydrogenase assembly protein OpcA [Chloroflexaceae bacterium]